VQVLQVARVLTFPLDEILIYATSLCIAAPFPYCAHSSSLHYRTTQAISGRTLHFRLDVLCNVCFTGLRSATWIVLPARLHGEATPIQVIVLNTAFSLLGNWCVSLYIHGIFLHSLQLLHFQALDLIVATKGFFLHMAQWCLWSCLSTSIQNSPFYCCSAPHPGLSRLPARCSSSRFTLREFDWTVLCRLYLSVRSSL